MPSGLKALASIKTPVMKKHYFLDFASVADAKKVLSHFKDSPMPQWIDPRSNTPQEIYIRFERSMDEIIAGRFRSHFYKVIGQHLAQDDFMNGKTLKMRVMNSVLLADVEGDPYELIAMPLDKNTKKCKVSPFFENFLLLGINQNVAEELVARATKSALEAAQ